MAKTTLDLKGWQEGLEKLNGPMRESLARRMGVAGGEVLRDEAKLRAPISDPPYNPTSRGSSQPGTLRDAIYLAFDKKNSTATQFSYSISWNNAKAFWGRFIEFGWWQKYTIGRKPDGTFYTDKSRPLKERIRHPAKPFLRPAFDAKIEVAKAAMIAKGREELPKILDGQ